MSIKCDTGGSCPFLYYCNTKSLCLHKNVFPVFGYEIGIMSIFPIASAICNLSGNSFGEFKVLLLMDLLNYQENEATTMAYPLITGTALYNFFDLILKRHPTKNTSLIDYNIVLIIIPNILFGSTIGSLVNKFIPPIVADSIIMTIMIGFSFKFFFRLKNYIKQVRKHEKRQSVQLFSSSKNSDQNKEEIQLQLTLKRAQSERVSDIEKQTVKSQRKQQATDREYTKNLQQLALIPAQNKEQLTKLQQYEAGLHVPHILATIAIFIIFQILSFLVQGKIIPFSICTIYYEIGISCLTALFLVFDFLMYLYTSRRVKYYKQIGYIYEPKINVPKYYLMICVGAFLGGFNGGVFGIGNSTTVIFTLLFMDLQPAIVSATVGYQVVFSGSASLAQAFATNQIPGNTALLFFLLTFIIGGILSFIAKKFVSRFSAVRVSLTLTAIIFCLVAVNVVALAVSIGLGYWQFGANNMQDVPFHC